KPEPTDIHWESSWGLGFLFLAERISFAFLRGFPAKAMQNYCFFPTSPNFSATFFKKTQNILFFVRF
ncbi:MAG: hypothetical protein K2M16_05040, partial [Muribaculaceae bacterium]|nr:hypothetical protein [Muribaculaceae bacterium]